MKKPLIILTGPTAVGKTELSIRLAKATGGEIISADSMQVYKKMNIGTAKATKEEMQGIPHHLIDILEPSEPFNVTIFKSLAEEAIDGVLERGHIPIIAGGTGFYIQGLLYDINFSEETDDGTRALLEKRASTEGASVLYEELKAVDPESSMIIHPNNIKKIIRALEFYHYNGYPISRHNAEERKKDSAYNSLYAVLTMNRTGLYERINKRVDIMMEAGLLREVETLYKDLGLDEEYISMQGIGYKELLPVVKAEPSEGEERLADAVEEIKQNTRHFAKRQLTWFRREKEVMWIDKDEYQSEEEIIDIILKEARERGIIR